MPFASSTFLVMQGAHSTRKKDKEKNRGEKRNGTIRNARCTRHNTGGWGWLPRWVTVRVLCTRQHLRIKWISTNAGHFASRKPCILTLAKWMPSALGKTGAWHHTCHSLNCQFKQRRSLTGKQPTQAVTVHSKGSPWESLSPWSHSCFVYQECSQGKKQPQGKQIPTCSPLSSTCSSPDSPLAHRLSAPLLIACQ